MDKATGQNLQAYELFDRIGSGGFGVVYRAYQSTLGREVAIKIILPGFANHPDFIRRFHMEAQLIARLEHLHIVPLYDFWRDPNGAYLVMRWLKGGNLSEALKPGPFDLSTAALFLDQIASALSHAHANGVIHRDVKPSNILLDEEGNSYLTDFGIALDYSHNGGGSHDDGLLSLNPDFISPEQARNEPVTKLSDIYSLGVILYEVLAGEHPFPDFSPVGRLYKHIDDLLPEIDTIPAEVSEGVNSVIQKATAKNPKSRYQDALEMATAFRQAAKLTFGRPHSFLEELTLREQGILERITAGLSNSEIAQELFIEVSTVKWYIRQIYRKLGVRSRRQAVVRAREARLFTLEEKPVETMEALPGLVGLPQAELLNPYKGLRAFESADARDFFGREALIQRLLSRLTPGKSSWQLNSPQPNGHFLAIVGPSGSGKSSLVKAGLVPAILNGAIKGSEGWFITQLEPGARPLDQLEVSLVRLAADQAVNLREQLERDRFGLVRAADLILPKDGSELLLVIDQFEELFTLVQEETTRARFLELLSAAALEPKSRVRIVIAMRADFYDRPLYYPQFGELVRNCLETVLPLSAEELERAILQPARQAGADFEPGLVTKIIEDVYYQPGALPMLQYALTELFEQRQERQLTHAAYQAIGETSGALAQRAEELYLEMSPAGREAVRQIFMRLVNYGDEGEGVQQAIYTRRRVLRAELLDLADEDIIDEIIDTYARYRLLSLDHDAQTRRPTVELAHEALLSKWERLRRMLEESREDLRHQRRLGALTQEWLQAGRESSFLLRGARLDQFERWQANTELALTADERAYLQASLAARQARREAEAARQEHERALERRSRAFLRGLVGVFAVATVVAVLLSLFAFGQQRLARQNESVAQQNAATAVAARGEAEQLASLRSRDAEVNQSLALAAQSRLALQAGNPDLALALAMEGVNIPNPPGQAQFALSEAAYEPGIMRVFVGHQAPIWSIAVSPDGRYGLSGDEAGVIFLWDLESGEALRRLEGHAGKVASLAFTPDGRQALSASQDKTILIWDLESAQVIRRLEGHQDGVNTVAISPDGRLAASGSGRVSWDEPFSAEDNSVRLWNLESGEVIQRYTFFTDSVTDVIFTPDGQHLLIATIADGLIELDLNTGKILLKSGGPDAMEEVVVSLDGQTALTAEGDKLFEVWDLRTGVGAKIGTETGIVSGLDISPDGKRAISSALDIIEYDLETETRIRTFNLAANTIAYLPDGRRALAGSSDGSLRVLALTSGTEIGRLPAGDSFVRGMVYSQDGRSAVADYVDTLFRWDLETGEEIWSSSVATGFWDIALSPDSKQLLAGTHSGIASLWDFANGIILHFLESDGSFEGHGDYVDAVAFHPSGKFALSGSQLGTTLIYWDLETRKPLWLFNTKENVYGVAVSPDGRTALSGEGDGAVNWWSLETGELLGRLEGHTNSVWSVAFVDDHTALSAAHDSTLILWDLKSGTVLRRFLGHAGPVRRVVLSPDKRLALSGSGDGTLILWDVQSGEALRHYSGHTDQVRTIAWRPDGLEALSGGNDGSVIRWRIDADLETLLKWVERNRYVRSLSCDERAAFHIEPLCQQVVTAGKSAGSPMPIHVTGAALLPPLPLPTPIPAGSPPASSPAVQAGSAVRGVNMGSISIGGGQVWEYFGQVGEQLSIRVAADRPVNLTWNPQFRLTNALFDPTLAIYAPDGRTLAQADDLENGVATDAYLAEITLPQTGIYKIEVRSFGDQTSGGYRLVLAEPRRLVFKTNVPTTAGLAIHPDGRTALVGVGYDVFFNIPLAEDNRIWVWDLLSGQPLLQLEGHANTPVHISISPDSLQALSAGADGVAILWDLQNWVELRRIDNQGQAFTGIQFLPDGRKALTSSVDATLALWDLTSGEVLQRFEGHGDWVTDFALSHGGDTAYSSSIDNTVRLWNVNTGELLATYQPFADGFTNGLAVSPDGEKILVGRDWLDYDPNKRYDAVIALLNAGTGELLRKLEGHTGVVDAIAFSPDGRYALSGSRDQTVRLWRVDTGEQLAVFTGHAGEIFNVAFSPDGLTGYSTGSDGALRVWDLRDWISP